MVIWAVYIFLLIISVIAVVVAAFLFSSGLFSDFLGVPYVPIKRRAIADILKFADVKPTDKFFDLGSGDGRVLRVAVSNFDVGAVIGYELSPWPYVKSVFLNRYHDVGEKIVIRRKDFFKADVENASVIFLYLYPKLMQKLASELSPKIKPKTKLICVSFGLKNPGADNFRVIKNGNVGGLNVFVYEKTD